MDTIKGLNVGSSGMGDHCGQSTTNLESGSSLSTAHGYDTTVKINDIEETQNHLTGQAAVYASQQLKTTNESDLFSWAHNAICVPCGFGWSTKRVPKFCPSCKYKFTCRIVKYDGTAKQPNDVRHRHNVQGDDANMHRLVLASVFWMIVTVQSAGLQTWSAAGRFVPSGTVSTVIASGLTVYENETATTTKASFFSATGCSVNGLANGALYFKDGRTPDKTTWLGSYDTSLYSPITYYYQQKPTNVAMDNGPLVQKKIGFTSKNASLMLLMITDCTTLAGTIPNEIVTWATPYDSPAGTTVFVTPEVTIGDLPLYVTLSPKVESEDGYGKFLQAAANKTKHAENGNSALRRRVVSPEEKAAALEADRLRQIESQKEFDDCERAAGRLPVVPLDPFAMLAALGITPKFQPPPAQPIEPATTIAKPEPIPTPTPMGLTPMHEVLSIRKPKGTEIPRPPTPPNQSQPIIIEYRDQVKEELVGEICEYFSELCNNMYEVLLDRRTLNDKPEHEEKQTGGGSKKKDNKEEDKEGKEDTGGKTNPRSRKNNKAQRGFEERQRKRMKSAIKGYGFAENAMSMILNDQFDFVALDKIKPVCKTDSYYKEQYSKKRDKAMLMKITKAVMETFSNSIEYDETKKGLLWMATVTPAITLHPRDTDKDFLVGIEPNPGPKHGTVMLKMLQDYIGKGTIAGVTALNRQSVHNNENMAIMVPRFHDSMFANIKTSPITVEGLVFNADTPVEVFNVIIPSLKDSTGADIAFPNFGALTAVQWGAEQGAGPNPVNSELTKNFDQIAGEMKEVVQILRSSSALLPGNVYLAAWSATLLQMSQDIEQTGLSPVAGSRSWILSNLMLMQMAFDANGASFCAQKHTMSLIKSSALVAPAAPQLFPQHAFHNVFMSATTQEEFVRAQFGANMPYDIDFGAGNVVITQNSMFVFVTDDMLGNTGLTRRGMQLYTIAHLPTPLWALPSVTMRVKDTINPPYNVNAQWAQNLHTQQWGVAQDPGLLIVFVKCSTNAVQGGFGAAAVEFTLTFGGQQVSSAINNPYRAGAQTALNITADILAIQTALLLPNAPQSAFMQASEYWARGGGTKSELMNAMIMTSIKTNYNTISPYVDASIITGFMDNGLTTLADEVNPVEMAEAFGTLYDCFYRPINNSSNYRYSFMEPMLRFTLMSGIRIPSKDRLAGRQIPGMNSTSLVCNSKDLFTLLTGYCDNIYEEQNRSGEQMVGFYENVQSQSDWTHTFSKELIEVLMEETKLQTGGISTIWAQPVTFGRPHITSATLGLWNITAGSFPKLVTDRSFVAFPEIYNNVSTNTIRNLDCEFSTKRSSVVAAGAAVGGTQLRTTIPDATGSMINKFQQPTIRHTALGGNNIADNSEFFVVSKSTNVAVIIMNPIVGPVMNKWRSAWLGTIAEFDASALETNLSYATTDPANGTTVSWDFKEPVVYAWDVDTDSKVQSGAPYSVAYTVSSVATSGFIYNTIIPDDLSLKRKPPPTIEEPAILAD